MSDDPNNNGIDFGLRCGNPLFGDWGGTEEAKGATFVDPPLGEICISCETPILEGEAGMLVVLAKSELARLIRTAGVEAGAEVKQFVEAFAEAIAPAAPVHRGCMLLDIAGHRLGMCSHTNYGGLGSRRAGAIELERRVYAAASIEALAQIGAAPRGRGEA